MLESIWVTLDDRWPISCCICVSCLCLSCPGAVHAGLGKKLRRRLGRGFLPFTYLSSRQLKRNFYEKNQTLFKVKLEGMAHYSGKILVPSKGFGFWSRLNTFR